jgi:putative Mg2+ transporter-C (MgtC) family protein
MWTFMVDDLRAETLVRIGLALLVGLILGLERERHGRAAGLRTILLVSLSACIAMIISERFYTASLAAVGSTPSWHPDPARLAAGALSGMGFLGAGVIIRQSDHIIQGVTTAATLWFATVIGLTFGCGAIGIGLVGTVVAFVVLHLLPLFEARLQEERHAQLSVQFDAAVSSVETVLGELKALAMTVTNMDIQTSRDDAGQRVVFYLQYKQTKLPRMPLDVTQRIDRLPGVRTTHWQS